MRVLLFAPLVLVWQLGSITNFKLSALNPVLSEIRLKLLSISTLAEGVRRVSLTLIH